MRLIFMGSPDFAVPALQNLINLPEVEVVAVYSQPPREKGRGKKVQKTPVHILAEAHDIPVYTPKSLRKEQAQKEFADLHPDLAVVAAYGLILPKEILEAPKFGCVNIHGSLLPRWRGAAPIHRAIEAGDRETGITIMQMDQGLDTGDMFSRKSIPIADSDSAQTIHDRLSELGAEMISEHITDLIENRIHAPLPQPEQGVTYAEKLDKRESEIDWSYSAEEIWFKVRAFNPWPGTWFSHNGDKIKVISAELVTDQQGKPGEVLSSSGKLIVACGESALSLTRLQRAGKSPMDVGDFLNGYDIDVGEQL